MNFDPTDRRVQNHIEQMRSQGLPDAAIRTFCHHLGELFRGGTGTLGTDVIGPVSELPDAESITDTTDAGVAALDRVVVIKLNGGLGTGMGLDRAKSLLEVRDGFSFLDLIARQITSFRSATGSRIPVLFMNSFRTAFDSERTLGRFPDLAVDDLPLGFLQHRVPKILAKDGQPARSPSHPELEWCPPGHGDLYTALDTSGMLDRLLERGYEFAFASNADNLGAVLDPTILGHMAANELPFMLEAADRTAADRKGGHLCRLADGRLALRESAQCPPDEEDQFQDIELYRYFNTNNLWIHLPSVRNLIDVHDGVIPLATIVNHKTLDPRDPSSPPVIQLETAMGTALSLFDRAAAIRVPRRRFSPVKNTDDLLGVRSDAFVLTDDSLVVLDEKRTEPPVVALDGSFFKFIDEFEARFPSGPPSLVHCHSLEVEGDVTFGRDVVLRGHVGIVADSPTTIADGSVIEGVLHL